MHFFFVFQLSAYRMILRCVIKGFPGEEAGVRAKNIHDAFDVQFNDRLQIYKIKEERRVELVQAVKDILEIVMNGNYTQQPWVLPIAISLLESVVHTCIPLEFQCTTMVSRQETFWKSRYFVRSCCFQTMTKLNKHKCV